MTTINLTNGDDVYTDGPAGDTINALDGNDTVYGGDGDDLIYGGNGDDVLYGGNGSNVLYGGAGNNTLYGGSGRNDFIVGDSVNAIYGGSGQNGAGLDFADSSADITFTLNLTPGSTSTFVGQGTTLTNVQVIDISTGSGNDNITGGALADQIWTGAGNDIVHGLGGSDFILGDVGNDALYGGDGDDYLAGQDGDDTIDGGAGTDQLDGGKGNDTLTYFDAPAGVTVVLYNGYQNTGGGGSDYISNFENLTGSAFNDVLTGESHGSVLNGLAGDDALYGGAGDDTLDGGSGNDTLNGGAGINTVTYATATAGVTVSLALTGAQNTGGSGVDTLTGFEKLIGSAFDDTLEGTAGDNTLDGGGGVNTVSYAHAGAAVSVDLTFTFAQVTGGAGTDKLTHFAGLIGSAFGDTLIGSVQNNAIDGGAGDDTITGGKGADTLTGGPGADHFVYVLITDSKVKPSGQDQITDFSHAQDDVIDLSALDANSALAGDQAFILVAGAFTGHAGELTQIAQSGGELVEADVNGDAKPDFAVFVHTPAPLVAGDFVL